jgi:CheY-like chemotaxis protein
VDNPFILIVEDNDDDSFLIQRVFQRAHILNGLKFVTNGEQAIAYLSGTPPYADRVACPLPDLVLLDLKMPRVDGFEVLRWIRAQPVFAQLRVVVLTSSTDVRDVNLAIQLGANGFLIKPADFLRLVEFSEALSGYWVWSQELTGVSSAVVACAASTNQLLPLEMTSGRLSSQAP